MIRPCNKCSKLGNCKIYDIITNLNLTISQKDSMVRNLTACTSVVNLVHTGSNVLGDLECNEYDPNREEAKRLDNELKWIT